jgi:chromosome segregation ATPase
LQSLLTEQAALTESTRASRNLLDSKHEKSRTLGDELLAARIDLATAQSTQQRLDRMQLENTRLRTDLQQDRDAVLDDVNRLRSRLAALPVALAELQRTNQAFREEVEARKAEIAAAGKELRPAEVRLDAANERLADVNRILAVVLEQLPNQALQLQRAEARITALIQELEQIPSLDAETGARARVTDNEAKLERLAIDLAVTKTLLTEVEGRLARIQPLQCRLLRARG